MFGLSQKRKNQMTHQDVKSEMERRKSHELIILTELKSKKVLYTHDLAKISYRYSARIGELRKKGHQIEPAFIRPGCWSYTYRGYKPNLRVA